MKHIPDNDSEIWNSYDADEKIICPVCNTEVFRYLPIGKNSEIDTIGSIQVCASKKGTYFHSNR